MAAPTLTPEMARLIMCYCPGRLWQRLPGRVKASVTGAYIRQFAKDEWVETKWPTA